MWRQPLRASRNCFVSEMSCIYVSLEQLWAADSRQAWVHVCAQQTQRRGPASAGARPGRAPAMRLTVGDIWGVPSRWSSTERPSTSHHTHSAPGEAVINNYYALKSMIQLPRDPFKQPGVMVFFFRWQSLSANIQVLCIRELSVIISAWMCSHTIFLYLHPVCPSVLWRVMTGTCLSIMVLPLNTPSSCAEDDCTRRLNFKLGHMCQCGSGFNDRPAKTRSRVLPASHP